MAAPTAAPASLHADPASTPVSYVTRGELCVIDIEATGTKPAEARDRFVRGAAYLHRGRMTSTMPSPS